MKIFINPGHDPNIDPGACANGLREADVVLKIGKRVEGYLRAVGYDAKLFQYDGLGEICFDANAWKADLFVSIHCNAATGSAKGTETFSSGVLEQLKAKAGKSIHLNCAYRCPTHNAEVGGVPNSQHVLGTAADITIPEIGFERARELVESLDFDGTGFYPPLDGGGAWFIHVDVRDGGIGSHIVWWD